MKTKETTKVLLKEGAMTRVRAGQSRQLVIPKKIWDSYHLNAGDLFDVEVDEKNRIIYTLQEVNSKDDSRTKWIKGLINADQKNPINLNEEKIVADKKIKEQLFKEKYGQAKK